MHVYVVLYSNFTAFDVFGPVEVLSNVPDYIIHFVSQQGGIVENEQGIRIVTDSFSMIEENGIVLIPGGFGTRVMIEDETFIQDIKNIVNKATYILCVCTGSALLAKTGILDNKHATSNKMAFDWVKSCGPYVKWNQDARWIQDGNIYTSAGVSAGVDMALGFVQNQFGIKMAESICEKMEYHWNRDAQHDDFAKTI